MVGEPTVFSLVKCATKAVLNGIIVDEGTLMHHSCIGKYKLGELLLHKLILTFKLFKTWLNQCTNLQLTFSNLFSVYHLHTAITAKLEL